MSHRFTRTPLVRIMIVVIAGAIGFSLASSASYGQQDERWQLFRRPPENARSVWYMQARVVASDLELDREASRQLMRTYGSARQAHLEKIEALPETQEAFQQVMEIGREARSSLEKSLIEALGEEKGKKAAALLGAFNFFFDHMVADTLAAENKSVAAILKYQAVFGKIMREAFEAGSFDGVQEKLRPPTVELGKQATQIWSEQQLTEWQEKYGWFFDRILSEPE